MNRDANWFFKVFNGRSNLLPTQKLHSKYNSMLDHDCLVTSGDIYFMEFLCENNR